MKTIPRDSTPGFVRPAYAPIPRDESPQVTTKPLPPVLPDYPPDFSSLSNDTGMTITAQGIHNDKPVVIAVDENGRILVNIKFT